jgi:hypothetical protein
MRQTEKELKEVVREEVAAVGETWREVKEISRKTQSTGVTSWTSCAPKLEEQNNDWLYILLQVSTIYVESCEQSVYAT